MGRYGWKIGDPLPVLGEHSLAKHDIYEQYVGTYIDRLAPNPRQTVLNLTIVDGFSGGGTYRYSTREVDGSPLRLISAIEAAERALSGVRAKGFSVRADYFFVDENQDHIDHLRAVLEKRGLGSRIGNDIFIRCSTFEESYPEVRRHVQAKGTAQRVIFFLDQFGWKSVRFETIRAILNDLKNPEILLTFAVDALIDFLSEKSPEAEGLMNIELGREDVRHLMELDNGDGWRYLIQNGLYSHVRNRTGAGYYTPFFIHSVKAHRSYWLLHLSNHRQARDEMGKLHWRINNSFQHLGGAGFHALGFDPSRDLRQDMLPFMFDDDARRRSEAAVMQQLPSMIHSATKADGALEVESLFAGNCNDTPVTSEILAKQILTLRDEGELVIRTKSGAMKPRSKTVDWDDLLVLPRERSLFTRLGW